MRSLGEVLADLRARRAAGESVSDADVIAANPELMPSLENVLRAMQAGVDTVVGSDDAATISAFGAEAATPFPIEPAAASQVRVTGYCLDREISRGGQGVVYEAVQESTGQRLALKVVHRSLTDAARQRERLDREVRILATLQHPNIVSILDRGMTADGLDYFAMRFIDGMAFDDWLYEYRKAHDPLELAANPAEALTLIRTICEGVQVAHEAGIVHRDLKPSNIRVDRNNLPHILDFGIARETSYRVSPESPLTLDGQFLGSLPWASPEQAEGKPELIDARTDVYALGVILYQALTGEFPYEVAGNMRDVLDNIIRVSPTPPSKVIAAKLAQDERDARVWREQHPDPINRQLEGIILKALAKRREDRYEHAGDLGADIGRYLSGQAPIARPLSPVSRGSKVPLLILALVVAILGLLVLLKQPTAEPSDLAPEIATVAVPPVEPEPPAVLVVDPEPEPAAETEPAPAKPPEETPTRIAAVRIIERGGSVILTGGGKVSKVANLPADNFNISTVHLTDNKAFTDEDCALLADLTHLSRLYFSNTAITDVGILHLKACTSITMMDLRRTDIGDAGMAAFSKMIHLDQLEMDGCMFSDEGLYHLRDLKKLGALRAWGAQISDKGIEYIKGNSRLSSLIVSGTRVTDKGMIMIAESFPRMRFLWASNTGVSDKSMPALAKLQALAYLQLDSTGITDEAMPYIGGLGSMVQLSISSTKVTDAGLEHLKGLTVLNYLDISHTKVSPDGLAGIKKAFPNCNIYKR